MKVLYKYRPDNQYTESIFKDKKIWLATVDTLNDPFECSMEQITIEAREEMIKTQQSAQLSGFIMSMIISLESGERFYHLDKKGTKQLYKKIKTAKSLQVKVNIMRGFFENLKPPRIISDFEQVMDSLDRRLKEVGIFSLSEDKLDSKMWAQYTGDHKGICIGFAVSEGSKLSNGEHCLKVEYLDEIAKFTTNQLLQSINFYVNKDGSLESTAELSFNDPNFHRAVKSKSLDWESEKEWRYIEPKAGSHEFPGAICEVLFGIRCSADRRAYLKELVETNISGTVKFGEIVREPGTNKMDVKYF